MKDDSDSVISQIEETSAFLSSNLGTAPNLVVVTGSGLGALAEGVDNPRSLGFSLIPSFPRTGVYGHPGRLLVGETGGYPVGILQGRIHFYEGFTLQEVVLPVRSLAFWGTQNFLLTNSSGAVNPTLQPGDLMRIQDHINLLGDNPLSGRNPEKLGPRFPDMTSAYDPELGKILQRAAQKRQIELKTGVYAAVKGPSFETPAEIQMLKGWGIDAVGMSTVPEVIALRHMGKRVVGLSCIANPAAGMGPKQLNHEAGTAFVESRVDTLVGLIEEFNRGLNRRTVNAES